jgi:hypothetical protein
MAVCCHLQGSLSHPPAAALPCVSYPAAAPLQVVEALLDSLPTMFTGNMVQESAMGPALQAAFLVTNHVGGKMLLFQSGVPSLGAGKVSYLLRAAAAACMLCLRALRQLPSSVCLLGTLQPDTHIGLEVRSS